MSEYDFPELPSDDELGITDEDRKEYEKDLPGDGPEMSDAELAALLGEVPGARAIGGAAKGSKGSGSSDTKKKKPSRAEAKAAKQAEKARKRAEKEAKTQARKAEKAKKATPQQTPTAAVSGDGEGAAAGAGTPARPVVEAGPRSRWRGPVTLALLLAMAAVASTRTGIPRPARANAPDTAFSSARAMVTLVDMARAAHPTGSPEHTRVREALIDRLSTLGLEPEVQTTTVLAESGSRARAATVRNIVARLPGTASTGTVLVTAHYDSREIAVGAADDGSGVVTILEAVRAISAGEPLENDLIVLFTDAEELGLLGARAFVDQHQLMADVDLVLSFEMRGGGGPSIMFETNEDNGWVVRTMQEWDNAPFANSMSYEVYKRMPNRTDFTPFVEAGAQGLNFAAIDNAHVYHQVYDTPDNLSESTLQHHGLHALGALRFYGDTDLSEVNDDNVVYFSLPGLGLIVYDKVWVLPLSVLLLVLFAIVGLTARRSGATTRGALLGFLASLLAGGAAWGIAYGMLRWLPDMHGESDALSGSVFHSEGWYLLALAFGTSAVFVAVANVFRRWASSVELTVGAVVLPLIAAVALGFVAPLGAMNLQWPVLAALASCLAVALLGDRGDGTVGWLVTVLLAAAVILIFEPIVELIWLALTLRLAGVLAVLITILLGLCLPALDALRHPNGWWAPTTTLVMALAATGLGILSARATPARPDPSTLVYAYEHGSGNAVWATSPGDDVERPGRAWAQARIAGDFTESRDLSDFGYRAGPVPVSPAAVSSAEPPAVFVVGDTVFQDRRLAVVRVRSRIGAESMQFHLDDGVELTAINGSVITDPSAVRSIDHWGIPEGDVLLELTMPIDTPIGVHIVEHLLRPQELLGVERFERPADLAPNVNWMSDRAMFRFSVAALADPQHAIVSIEAPPEGAFDDAMSLDTMAAPDTMAVPDTSAVPVDTAAVIDTIRTSPRRPLP